MKITDIKQQVRIAGRYSIYVDGKFSFGLSENGLLASGLRVGQEINQSDLNSLKDTAKEDKAYNMALNLIVRRPRSEWEIRQYFKQKEYDKELIDILVKRLYQGKWLDDKEFARKWVANRRLLKATSKRKLSLELKAKRVSDEIISQVLASDETDENEVLLDLIKRKKKQTRYQDEQKLIAYLVMQGFNYSDVKEALRNNIED